MPKNRHRNNIYFASSNPEKIREVKLVLSGMGIKVLGKKIELNEPSLDSPREIAACKARNAFAVIRRPVIAEDTAIYFNAVKNFPGVFAARAFKRLGFTGLLRKIEGRARGAKFVTCVAYCDSIEREARVFTGICRGRILRSPVKIGVRGMKFPYERIFRPCGSRKPLCLMSAVEKARNSHRAKALKKFARWFKAQSRQ